MLPIFYYKNKDKKMTEFYSTKTWAVNNVDNKAKDMAKKMARANRKKIGQWLTDLILNQSENNNFTDGVPIKILLETLNHINLKLIELREEIEVIKRNQIPVKRSFWDKIR
jgi:hypothetical protein